QGRRAGAGGGDDRAGVGDGRPYGHVVPGDGDPLAAGVGRPRERHGEGGGVMSGAYVSVRVAEQTRLSAHLRVSGQGVLDAWIYTGEGKAVVLWGSPGGGGRLAASLVVAAQEADELLPPRAAAELRDGALVHSCRPAEPGLKVVRS